MMTTRTVSIRVEATISVDSKADLAEVLADLTERARSAVESSPRTQDIWHAGTVTRRPNPGEGDLR